MPSYIVLSFFSLVNLVQAVSDMLKIPILVFQPCTNLAGYKCVQVALPAEEQSWVYRKMIYLTHCKKVYFDMLVVTNDQETEFKKRILELLCCCGNVKKGSH
jgi:hypothetical protein